MIYHIGLIRTIEQAATVEFECSSDSELAEKVNALLHGVGAILWTDNDASLPVVDSITEVPE